MNNIQQVTVDQTIEDYEKQIAALEQNLDEMTIALTHAWNQLVPFLQDTSETDTSQGLEPILQAVLAAIDVPLGGIYLLRDREWLTSPPDLPQRNVLSAYLNEVRSHTLFTWRYYDEGKAELWLFSPIITNDEIIGYIGIASEDIQRQFAEAERRILIRMAERAAGQIGAIQLAEMRQREAAARRELEIASHIQRSIQPKAAPSVPSLDVAFYWEPARQVGGDACGWFIQPDGTLNWFILDVSGKGLPAALAAVSLYTAFRMGLRLGQAPDAILRLANEEFYQAFTDSNLMATAAIFSLNPQTG
ncbi:MAG: SpoIIE family protein phosphatase, partial [Anaerolineae bacterium]|nr:SpoIIE family protein phosphatase [Anaerolineae bacterium]